MQDVTALAETPMSVSELAFLTLRCKQDMAMMPCPANTQMPMQDADYFFVKITQLLDVTMFRPCLVQVRCI